MVPPGEIFGFIPLWIGVFAFAALGFGFAGYVVYTRVFRLVMLGKMENRFDHPIQRSMNALVVVLGQRKVLQRVSMKDKAGLGHVAVFWGFLCFALSYVLFVFLDSINPHISETILTDTGVKVYVFCIGRARPCDSDGADLGSGAAVAGQAPTSELRPDPELGCDHHRGRYCKPDDLHLPGGRLLQRDGESGPRWRRSVLTQPLRWVRY